MPLPDMSGMSGVVPQSTRDARGLHDYPRVKHLQADLRDLASRLSIPLNHVTTIGVPTLNRPRLTVTGGRGGGMAARAPPPDPPARHRGVSLAECLALPQPDR